jgi:protein SCO1/2
MSRLYSSGRRLLLSFVLCAAPCLFASYVQAESESYVQLKKPIDVKPFELSDQYGQPFNLDSLKDHWSMIFIGFTTCPDVCPVTLSNLEAVRAELGLRLSPDRIPRIIFLAVDPQRDAPVLKEYLAYFHPEYVGISGEVEQIDSLINSLKAFYRLDKKTPDDQAYEVLHTAFVSVINPDGQMVAKLNPPFQPHKTANSLFHLMHGITFDD